MTLLYILAFLLLCVALNQVFKVVELARDLKNTREWRPTEKDNRLNARLMLVFLVAFLSFFVWQIIRFGGDRILPVAASEHGVKIDWLMNVNYALIVFVFFATFFFLFGFAWRYYGRENVKAPYSLQKKKLKMIWTVTPAI